MAFMAHLHGVGSPDSPDGGAGTLAMAASARATPSRKRPAFWMVALTGKVGSGRRRVDEPGWVGCGRREARDAADEATMGERDRSSSCAGNCRYGRVLFPMGIILPKTGNPFFFL